MADILDFAKVSSIEGVKSYYLVKYNGAIVSCQGESAETLCPYIAFSGLNSDAIRSLLKYSKLNYLVFWRKCRENMIIFSLGNHFLAVIKKANAPTPDLIRKISELIKKWGNTVSQNK